MVPEFGDLTQILTAGLAARYHHRTAVGIGPVAMWAVAALAITGGRSLPKVISLARITRIAAVAMLVLAGISLVAAIRRRPGCLAAPRVLAGWPGSGSSAARQGRQPGLLADRADSVLDRLVHRGQDRLIDMQVAQRDSGRGCRRQRGQ